MSGPKFTAYTRSSKSCSGPVSRPWRKSQMQDDFRECQRRQRRRAYPAGAAVQFGAGVAPASNQILVGPSSCCDPIEQGYQRFVNIGAGRGQAALPPPPLHRGIGPGRNSVQAVYKTGTLLVNPKPDQRLLR